MATGRALRSTLVRSPVMLRRQVYWADTDDANTNALLSFWFGQEAISGTLAVTEEDDTVAFAGSVLTTITGALAVTEGDDTVLFLLGDGTATGTRIGLRVTQPPRRMMRRERGGPRSSRGFY